MDSSERPQTLADRLDVHAEALEADCREMHGFGFDKWGKDCCASAGWAIDARAAAAALREAERRPDGKWAVELVVAERDAARDEIVRLEADNRRLRSGPECPDHGPMWIGMYRDQPITIACRTCGVTPMDLLLSSPTPKEPNDG